MDLFKPIRREPIDIITDHKKKKPWHVRLADRWRKFVRVMRTPIMESVRDLLPSESRSLTPDERREMAARREAERKARAEEVRRTIEGLGFQKRLSNTLANLDVSWRYKVYDEVDKRRRTYEQKVRFDSPLVFDESGYYYRIDTRPGRLPRRVTLADINDPNALQLMSINCGYHVSFLYDPSRPANGAWLYVNTGMAVRQIPGHVRLADMLDKRPAALSSYHWPIGVTANGHHRWESLLGLKHVLICGSTGGGKSNALNVLLCTLLMRNTPDTMKLMLVDMKAGMELYGYRGLPHVLQVPRIEVKSKSGRKSKVLDEGEDTEIELVDISVSAKDGDDDDPFDYLDEIYNIKTTDTMRPAFFTTPRGTVAALIWLISEIKRRGGIIRGKARNIDGYNKRHPESALPYIVCVIDEWAKMWDDAKAGKHGDLLLASVLNQGRALGIHVVVCTQSPLREVITTKILNNIDARVVFRMTDKYISMKLMGSEEAVYLERPGRGFFVDGPRRAEFQCPMITDDMVRDTIAAITEGNTDAGGLSIQHDVSAEEIWRWAITHNRGYIGAREIYVEFQTRGMSMDAARLVYRKYRNQVVTVDGVEYVVSPPAIAPEGRMPPRLLPASAERTAAPQIAPPDPPLKTKTPTIDSTETLT
jgi:hypothetical protein